MYDVPVLFNNDLQPIGSISLNREVERLLEEGYTFVLNASVMLESQNTRKIVAVNISPLPATNKNIKEMVEFETKSLSDYFKGEEKND